MVVCNFTKTNTPPQITQIVPNPHQSTFFRLICRHTLMETIKWIQSVGQPNKTYLDQLTSHTKLELGELKQMERYGLKNLKKRLLEKRGNNLTKTCSA